MMHKTLLAAFIVGASALTIPAFAQVNLGGAGQVGARVNAGAVAHDTMRTADQAGARAADTTRTVNHKARHTTHHVVDKTKSTVDENGNVDANMHASASPKANAAGANGDANANVDAGAGAGAGLDTAATAGKAGAAGQGVGGEVRDSAHSAIQSTDRSAGSVGAAVNNTSASGAADANTKAGAEAHGH